jgi:arylsulfatase A-like enzyme
MKNDSRRRLSWFTAWAVAVAGASLIPLIPAAVDVWRNGYIGQGMIRAAAAGFESRYWDWFLPCVLVSQLFLVIALWATRWQRSVRQGVWFAATTLFIYTALQAAVSKLFFNLFIVPNLVRFGMLIHNIPQQREAPIQAIAENLVSPMLQQPLLIPQIMGLGIVGKAIYIAIQLFVVLAIVAITWIAVRFFVRLVKKRPRIRKKIQVPLFSLRSIWLLAFSAIPCLIVIPFSILFSSADPAPPPNIVLISIDTLRADHLSCYGYSNSITPTMDRLAGDGILFEKAISQSSWTLPSHASMLTGLYPIEHGCNAVQGVTLSPKVNTIAEYLSNSGYRTMAVTSTLLVSRAYGLGQGFERFHFSQSATADDLIDVATRFVSDHQDEPFFLFLHLFDPHHPYTAPEAYRSMFVSDAEFKEVDGNLDHIWPEGGATMIEAHKLDILRRLYDAEIRFTDVELGRFIDTLSTLDLLNRTAIILTSDHGESFGENGEFYHGSALYNQQIHVPLILRYPGRISAGQRSKRVVEASSQILPSIMDLANLPIPESLAAGSLLAPAPDENGLAHSETSFPYEPQYSMQDRNWKLIAKTDGASSPMTFELFDQVSDWPDSHDMADDRPEIVAHYQTQSLAEYLNLGEAHGLAPGPKVKLSPDQIEQLRSLGYIQ